MGVSFGDRERVADGDASAAHDVGTQARAVDEPTEDAGIGERLQVPAGFAQLGSHALDRADTEALADQVVEPHAARKHLPAGLLVRQFDAGVVAEALERLGLDQGDVPRVPIAVAHDASGTHLDLVDWAREGALLGR
jgi:hypothetical protein